MVGCNPRTEHMRRRDFIAGGLGCAAWSRAARAQQPDRPRRIGFLITGSERDAELQLWIAAFKDGLQRLGWTDGHNVRIEVHWAGADVNRARLRANFSKTTTSTSRSPCYGDGMKIRTNFPHRFD